MRRLVGSLGKYGAWVPSLFHGDANAAPSIQTFPGRARRPVGRRRSVRVLSLNVAHGRADTSHQLLQSSQHRRQTLLRIAELLEREGADIVGLQEADGPSLWSGGFCHVASLARAGRFSFAAHGMHVQGPGLRYGTALLSHLELGDAVACTFRRSPPTPAKGFTVAAVNIDTQTTVDVVSVHLDFLHADVRARQVRQMAQVLACRRRPLIVMGDLNADWRDDNSAVHRLAVTLGLVAHSPHAGAPTFPANGARLDWILASPEFVFEHHAVLPDVVSDHFPIVADLRLRGP